MQYTGRLPRCARNDANPPGPAGLPPLARGTSNLALLVKRRRSHSGDEIRSWHRRCEELSDAAISNNLYYKTLRALTLLPILLFKTGPSCVPSRDSGSLVQISSSPHSTPYTPVQNRSLFFLVETGCYAIPGASGTRRIQRRRRDSGSLVQNFPRALTLLTLLLFKTGPSCVPSRDSGSLVQISSSPHSTPYTPVQNRPLLRALP